MKKKLFIFDLDGTLVDAYQAIWETLLYTLEKLGYPPVDFETAKMAVGHGDKKYIPRFFKPEDVEKASKIYREIHLKKLDGKVKLLPGAKELLQKLKQKEKLTGLASNRPCESGVIILKITDLQQYFDRTIFGDQVKNQKPDPEILLNLIDFFKLSKEETVFIGDMDIDVETGKKAGVDTIVVPTGSSTLKQLENSKPSRICNSLFEILKMLEDELI